MTTRARANGEGSIFPYRNGRFAAYVWVTTPAGERKRKYVYGKTRREVHDKWIKLQRQAQAGPVATKIPTLAAYLDYWIREVVDPGVRPKTAETYAMHVRVYIVPGLGGVRLDKLTVRGVRTWLNSLTSACQCCAQGRDAARAPKDQRCCARGQCCQRTLSRRTIQDIRAVLRAALNNAITEDLITKNPAGPVKVPSLRRRKVDPWSVEEARRFLVSARVDGDAFYPAYVLILALGLRRGEVLGLTWPCVSLDSGQLVVSRGLQRIQRKLVLGETKSEASDASLPLPEICVAALRLREKAQAAHRAALGTPWPDADELVFTTRYGAPIDPRNFVRSFKRRCIKAGVRSIRVHDTRHTCGSLLAALDVHPRVAMQILRHSKIAVTMEIYTHVPSELTMTALKKLAQSLDDLAPEE
jgi:integrase